VLNIEQYLWNSLKQSTREKHQGDIRGEFNISEVSIFFNYYHLPKKYYIRSTLNYMRFFYAKIIENPKIYEILIFFSKEIITFKIYLDLFRRNFNKTCRILRRKNEKTKFSVFFIIFL
jgi:hypothetical protein